MVDKENHLHAAPVSSDSQKSFGLMKGGATKVKDVRGPGLDYLRYVLFMFEQQSSVRDSSRYT